MTEFKTKDIVFWACMDATHGNRTVEAAATARGLTAATPAGDLYAEMFERARTEAEFYESFGMRVERRLTARVERCRKTTDTPFAQVPTAPCARKAGHEGKCSYDGSES